MSKGRTVVLCLGLAVGAAGCSLTKVPDHPTYGQVFSACQNINVSSQATENEYRRCMDSADKLLKGRG